MKTHSLVLTALLSFIVAFATAHYTAPKADNEAAAASAYDRVLQSGILRCGYSVVAPYFTKDAATGALGGIWYDLTEQVADHLGLKTVWVQEVGLGEIATALDTGRIDMFCGGLWTAGQRVRAVDFLKPSAFEPLLAYVRTNDHRFDASLALLNNPDLRVSAIDGEGGGLAATEEFPKATLISLPQSASYADMYNQVATGKADVFFAAPSGAAVYIKNNPGIVRPIVTQPLRIFPLAFAVRYGEDKLRDMLNQAQDDVLMNGSMEKVLSAHEVNKGDFWRVARPYAQPQAQ